jgi:hypothetical protein
VMPSLAKDTTCSAEFNTIPLRLPTETQVEVSKVGMIDAKSKAIRVPDVTTSRYPNADIPMIEVMEPVCNLTSSLIATEPSKLSSRRIWLKQSLTVRVSSPTDPYCLARSHCDGFTAEPLEDFSSYNRITDWRRNRDLMERKHLHSLATSNLEQ